MRKIMLLGMAGLAAAMLWGCQQEPSGIAVSDGTVTQSQYSSVSEMSEYHIPIMVDEVLKGEPPETLVVVQEGGEAQNEITPPPEEFPLLEVGKTYLLYLNDDYIHDGETLYTVVGGYQGVAVDTDGEWTALSETNRLWPVASDQ